MIEQAEKIWKENERYFAESVGKIYSAMKMRGGPLFNLFELFGGIIKKHEKINKTLKELLELAVADGKYHEKNRIGVELTELATGYNVIIKPYVYFNNRD